MYDRQINPLVDLSQHMILWNQVFQPHAGKQGILSLLSTFHAYASIHVNVKSLNQA